MVVGGEKRARQLSKFSHKSFPIDDESDVNTLADDPLLVGGADREGQLAPLDGRQYGGRRDRGSQLRGFDV